jgi:hypothetical protein
VADERGGSGADIARFAAHPCIDLLIFRLHNRWNPA